MATRLPASRRTREELTALPIEALVGPALTGSLPTVNAIGIVDVAAFAASGVSPSTPLP